MDPADVKRMAKKGITAPNCPTCGEYMDKVEVWVCRKCGKLAK